MYLVIVCLVVITEKSGEKLFNVVFTTVLSSRMRRSLATRLECVFLRMSHDYLEILKTMAELNCERLATTFAHFFDRTLRASTAILI